MNTTETKPTITTAAEALFFVKESMDKYIMPGHSVDDKLKYSVFASTTHLTALDAVAGMSEKEQAYFLTDADFRDQDALFSNTLTDINATSADDAIALMAEIKRCASKTPESVKALNQMTTSQKLESFRKILVIGHKIMSAVLLLDKDQREKFGNWMNKN